jgi:hypothetical protein
MASKKKIAFDGRPGRLNDALHPDNLEADGFYVSPSYKAEYREMQLRVKARYPEADQIDPIQPIPPVTPDQK